MRDREIREPRARIVNRLDLEPRHHHRLDDLIKRRLCDHVITEPVQGEFHYESPPATLGVSQGRKP